jgi:hypothetical protein
MCNIQRLSVSLFDSSWIRKICRILNDIITSEKNATESTQTKVSLEMAEKDAVKDQGAKSSR